MFYTNYFAYTVVTANCIDIKIFTYKDMDTRYFIDNIYVIMFLLCYINYF